MQTLFFLLLLFLLLFLFLNWLCTLVTTYFIEHKFLLLIAFLEELSSQDLISVAKVLKMKWYSSETTKLKDVYHIRERPRDLEKMGNLQHQNQNLPV